MATVCSTDRQITESEHALLLLLVVVLQVVPGVRDMQMLQQRATGAEFVADNMQPA
jgi:hypothetical protein